MTSPQTERPAGLRERKKAKTRDSIQAHAIKLFSDRGYTETTVEQIAEAADVSPSTFFRYFPTKEDSVLYDRLDPVLVASFLRQPAELSPIEALRHSISDVYERISTEETEREQARHVLIFSVPELQSRLIERFGETMSVFTEAVAERVGRDRDDPRVLVFSGAVLGAMLAGVYGHSDTVATQPPSMLNKDMMKRIHEALGLLEHGLPL